ncbi:MULTISPECIES: hypothetical protein [Clostridium]|uniref:DUF1292 domain-containing protein n=1 Tax=Clostridium cadaveris TaxID=1529 RepID=A0A1I2KXB8_9CLOT|nr:hypothetical protein [Clostridium cadaveris]MDM8313583.1 DUF1292 domain-containing protein [Clostridium cadaveris]MDU4952807.1 DUF1292 domain-containing protein [Clostridium sp.]UFH64244.1 DUF1292 domain-containing protein [Clostridium cadaveris]SFF69546.1 hypothetical protein SAMN04487885_1072 [Clostridium cadaveris]
MSTREFIEKEKDSFGKVFVDINYAIDNISPFLEKDELSKRKYVIKLPVLDKYIDMLEASETSSNKKKGLFSMFKGDSSISNLESYKSKNIESLNQLVTCSTCKCLNCVAECKFKACSDCRRNSHTNYCDHERFCVTFHDNFTLDLTNNDTGRRNKYKTLATIKDCNLDKRYILIENIVDKDDKFILYYYPTLSGDEFGEIEDVNEFDTIAGIYEQSNY